MPFADHHDMVKAFPSNRSNHALGIGVLPVTLASRSPGEVGGGPSGIRTRVSVLRGRAHGSGFHELPRRVPRPGATRNRDLRLAAPIRSAHTEGSVAKFCDGGQPTTIDGMKALRLRPR